MVPDQQHLPGVRPPLPEQLTRAAHPWWWGGPGRRSGVWLQRAGDWQWWTWPAIGRAADAEHGATRIVRQWFVPTRCRDALDELHASGAWVDRALGAEPPNEVDEWETGRRRPDRGQIRRLAWLTGRPVSYFCPDGGVASITYARACVRGAGGGMILVEVPGGRQ